MVVLWPFPGWNRIIILTRGVGAWAVRGGEVVGVVAVGEGVREGGVRGADLGGDGLKELARQ
jgi:hypothetical protein